MSYEKLDAPESFRGLSCDAMGKVNAEDAAEVNAGSKMKLWGSLEKIKHVNMN